MISIATDETLRPCVGIMLLNREGKVFVGARSDLPDMHWQMPQGGIDAGESPRMAALRELREEIGTDRAELVAELDRWIPYIVPPDLARQAWNGRYRGQKQRWFAMRFVGTDEDIRIDGPHREFKDWKWVEIDDLVGLVVPFKRPVYREVVAAFRHLAVPQ